MADGLSLLFVVIFQLAFGIFLGWVHWGWGLKETRQQTIARLMTEAAMEKRGLDALDGYVEDRGGT